MFEDLKITEICNPKIFRIESGGSSDQSSNSDDSDYIFMSDNERFTMTEANLCVLLLDRLMHGDDEKQLTSIESDDFAEIETQKLPLFKAIVDEFDRKRKRNEFYSFRVVLNFCIQAANMGIILRL